MKKILIATTVFAFALFFGYIATKTLLVKNDGLLAVPRIYGTYSPGFGSGELKKPEIFNSNNINIPIKCDINSIHIINRVDEKKHPLIHQMLKNNSGYCGIYSFLLSAYHTFGIKTIQLDRRTGYGIESEKGNVNLSLVEAYLKRNPGYMGGMTPEEQIDLYEGIGKSCIQVNLSTEENELTKQCKDLASYKNQGYNCSLNMYRPTSGHVVNIKSVFVEKNSCNINVYNTGDQYDPKLDIIDNVNVSHYKSGYNPKINYSGVDNRLSKYTNGGNYICCK